MINMVDLVYNKLVIAYNMMNKAINNNINKMFKYQTHKITKIFRSNKYNYKIKFNYHNYRKCHKLLIISHLNKYNLLFHKKIKYLLEMSLNVEHHNYYVATDFVQYLT